LQHFYFYVLLVYTEHPCFHKLIFAPLLWIVIPSVREACIFC